MDLSKSGKLDPVSKIGTNFYLAVDEELNARIEAARERRYRLSGKKSPVRTPRPSAPYVLRMDVGHYAKRFYGAVEAEVRRTVTEWLGDLIANGPTPPPRTKPDGCGITVEEAAARWAAWLDKSSGLSVASRRGYVNVLGIWFRRIVGVAEKDVSELSVEDMDGFVNPKDRTARRATRTQYLAMLRNFVSFCRNNGWLSWSPDRLTKINHRAMSHAELEPKEREPLTEEEQRKLLGSLKGMWLVAATLSLDTGLRLSDILGLEWANWNPETRTIVRWTRKRLHRVEVKVPERSARALAAIPKNGDSPHVFPRAAAIVASGNTASLSASYKKRAKAAGVNKSFHLLRHTHAHAMRAAGRTIAEIGDRLGHSNEHTTKIYTGER